MTFQTNGFHEEWSSTDPSVIEETVHQVSAMSAHGRLTIHLVQRLVDIVEGEVDPLSLMLEDDLLNKYHAENPVQDRVYQQAARFVGSAAYNNPRLRILEIGAGTGYVFSRSDFLHPYWNLGNSRPRRSFNPLESCNLSALRL